MLGGEYEDVEGEIYIGGVLFFWVAVTIVGAVDREILGDDAEAEIVLGAIAMWPVALMFLSVLLCSAQLRQAWKDGCGGHRH